MRDSVTRTIARYRSLSIEYSALKVVSRGLFMILVLMVILLYVFVRVTDVIDGTNEVLIPTVAVNPDVDLGALAQGAFSRTSASVVSVVGLLTLIVSTLFTAHAVRQGSHRALLGDDARRIRLLDWRTIAAATALAVGILATWVLTLATSIRHRAWVAILGWDVPTVVVDAGKVAAVGISLVIVATGVAVTVRAIAGRLTNRALVAAGLAAIVIAAMNFLLLYTYIGALINPAVSAGLVLVFALLLWVNICVRIYLGALCWLGSAN